MDRESELILDSFFDSLVKLGILKSLDAFFILVSFTSAIKNKKEIKNDEKR
jgi:hypothetical protein